MLWIFFLSKQSLVTSVTLLLRSDANDMWVPSMAPKILGNLVRSRKQSIIFCTRSLDGILIYLLNNLFLSHRSSHTMSIYFLFFFHIFSCYSHIEPISHVCGTSSMSQPINHNGYNFSYFYLWLDKVHTFGIEEMLSIFWLNYWNFQNSSYNNPWTSYSSFQGLYAIVYSPQNPIERVT